MCDSVAKEAIQGIRGSIRSLVPVCRMPRAFRQAAESFEQVGRNPARDTCGSVWDSSIIKQQASS